MTPKTLLSAAAAGACMALAACQHLMIVPPAPPSRTDCSGGGICKVDIVPDGSCTGPTCTGVSPDVKFTSTGLVRVLWKLPPQYGFCTLKGDGVFLKSGEKDDGQFEDPYATDDDVHGNKPDSPKACHQLRVFHWRALNTAAGNRYQYEVKFHDVRTGKGYSFVVDPWIINN